MARAHFTAPQIQAWLARYDALGSVAATIRELGYPTRSTANRWRRKQATDNQPTAPLDSIDSGVSQALKRLNSALNDDNITDPRIVHAAIQGLAVVEKIRQSRLTESAETPNSSIASQFFMSWRLYGCPDCAHRRIGGIQPINDYDASHMTTEERAAVEESAGDSFVGEREFDTATDDTDTATDDDTDTTSAATDTDTDTTSATTDTDTDTTSATTDTDTDTDTDGDTDTSSTTSTDDTDTSSTATDTVNVWSAGLTDDDTGPLERVAPGSLGVASGERTARAFG